MKSEKLKGAAIITLVVALFNFLWGRIVALLVRENTFSPLIRKLGLIRVGRIQYPVFYLLLSIICALIGMGIALFVFKKFLKKGRLSGGFVALSLFFAAAINAVLNITMSRLAGMSLNLNKTLSGWFTLAKIALIFFAMLFIIPKEKTSKASAENYNANSMVKTEKEEASEGNKWATIYIVAFIAIYGVGYAITSKMLLSIGIGFLGFIVLYVLKKTFSHGEDAEKATIKKAMTFYNECNKIDLLDFTSEKNIARAEAIAKANLCGEISDYAAFYEMGKKYAKELSDRVEYENKQERIAKLKEEEAKLSTELNKYATSTDNNKTIGMLNAELSSLISQKSALENFGSNSAKLLSQKERDWATAGGIASGIAGGAAGVATALDIQAKNAEIRAHNNQVQTDAIKAQMYINQSGAIGRLESQIEDKRAELEREKIKLVGKIAPDELLSMLNIDNITANISESGSVYVDAKVSLHKSIMIYEDVNARIDGTIKAIVSKDGREIARVNLVFPKYGVTTNGFCNVKGINMVNAACEEDLDVTFEATNLYAIEQ